MDIKTKELRAYSHRQRVKACYTYYNYFSEVLEKSDYTDGMYFGISLGFGPNE